MTPGSPSSADPGRGEAPLPEPVLARIEAHLAERERRREELFQRARVLRRLSQATVARLHTHGAATEELDRLRTSLGELLDALRREGRSEEPVALDALQEAVEASLVAAIVGGHPLPTPDDLRVAPEPYLLGLGDTIGEVRRLLLARLGTDDLAGAERFLGVMERLTDALLRFDTARAIVALKPKQDAARLLLERTRGEVVLARLLLRVRPPEGR